MRFTGLAAALFLVLYFVKIEYEKNGWKWGNYSDYALLVSLIVLILGFVFDIWKTFKDRKDSQKEHDGIKENDNKNKDLLDKNKDLLVTDHQRLSTEHNRISSELNNKHSQINAIYALNQQLPTLQFEKQQVTEKYETLLKKHADLGQQYHILQLEHADLQEKYDELVQSADQEETEDFTQSID